MTLSLYWPIRAEPDLRAWMGRLSANGVRLALPVAVALGQPLQFREWRPHARLARGLWKIPYPADGVELDPTVVIAPLVGFDRACYRLGYGGGFFDRTLAQRAPRPLAIGVGYPSAALQTIFPQVHDVPMDWIVTGSSALGGPCPTKSEAPGSLELGCPPPIASAHLARRVLFGFILTFIASRIVVLLIMARQMPNLYFFLQGTHVHHLNYGIFLLAGVGAYLLFFVRSEKGTALCRHCLRYCHGADLRRIWNVAASRWQLLATGQRRCHHRHCRRFRPHRIRLGNTPIRVAASEGHRSRFLWRWLHSAPYSMTLRCASAQLAGPRLEALESSSSP